MDLFHFVLARLMKLPGCLLVGLIGMLVDVPLITVVTLWKSPYMLFRGLKRLFEDLIGREGPFLETVCVPFAGLAILLWPLAVVGAVVGAIIASFFLGLYGGVIVHQVWKMFLSLFLRCYIRLLFQVLSNICLLKFRKIHFIWDFLILYLWFRYLMST